jgi:hypothetical protein
MSVDKSELLERVRICTADLEPNIVEFVSSRIKKNLY